MMRPMFNYDPQLVIIVKSNPTSITELVGALQRVHETCIDTGGLKWFNHLYLQVTRLVQDRVARRGFNDPNWLRQLDLQFAALYFSALRAVLQGSPCPGC